LRAAVATCLAFTWLNPHVYLDTVVLLGGIAARLAFGIGAASASFLFFVALGYGARRLAPFFARPGAWRLLDTLVGLTMWLLALGLITG
jgi:L-lysine exporter family protein LysE/ArgO